MPLIKYTTQIPAKQTIGEIIAILCESKAKSVSQQMSDGQVVGLDFTISTRHGDVTFRLPADCKKAAAVMQQQAKAGLIPRRLANDAEQARRVAWRIVHQWVEAQLAMIHIGLAQPEQVFLPYAIDKATDRTVYEVLDNRSFKGLIPESVS